MSIDWNKPIETTSGKPAKAVSRDFKSPNRGFDVVVQFEEDYESRLGFYTQDGRPVYAGPLLRNKTKKVTKWSNLYRTTDGASVFIAGPWWDTEKAANEHGSQALRWIKSIEVTWDEPCD